MNRYIKLIAIGCGLIAIFNSCKENTGGIGKDVLPKSDQIGAFNADTSTLITSMYLKYPVSTSNILNVAYISNVVLGSYTDPIFGVTKASVYAPVFSPTTLSSAGWADSCTVDSAVLILPYLGQYSSYYGSLDPQTFEVDTVETIIHSVTYPSDSTLKYDALHPIGSQQVTPPDPLYQDTVRIRMNKNWYQSIFNKLKANHNYYTSFDSLVRGIYITTNNPLQLPGQGGLLYINLNSTTAGIYLYYHGPTPNTGEYRQIFPVGGSNATYFTHVDHNYATAPFYTGTQSGKHDSISANNMMYVQTLGGAVGRITFPYIHNWSKLNPVIINQAEIDIPVNTNDITSVFSIPTQMYIYGTDANGVPYNLPDLGTAYYDGTYDSYNHEYKFVITNYIQHVIDGKTIDRGLYIIPGYDEITANRVVLYGAENGVLPASSPRIKLKIFYTPLK